MRERERERERENERDKKSWIMKRDETIARNIWNNLGGGRKELQEETGETVSKLIVRKWERFKGNWKGMSRKEIGKLDGCY